MVVRCGTFSQLAQKEHENRVVVGVPPPIALLSKNLQDRSNHNPADVIVLGDGGLLTKTLKGDQFRAKTDPLESYRKFVHVRVTTVASPSMVTD